MIDSERLLAEVENYKRRDLVGFSKRESLEMVLSMIDLTTLEGSDTEERVRELCHKAQHLSEDLPELPTTAAVCVYPVFVKVAREALGEENAVKLASVAAGFPSGQTFLDLKLEEVKRAVGDGADEIDMVISRGRFLSGDEGYVFDEIAAIKEACGEAHLKVILETGELGSLQNVRRASDIAISAGADFIKTSTGKIGVSATLPVTLVMLKAIRDYHVRSGKMVGMKPAGGISSAGLALQYLVMVQNVLGDKWLKNKWFRFGASSLANDVIKVLLGGDGDGESGGY